jgi:hypothetical protein
VKRMGWKLLAIFDCARLSSWALVCHDVSRGEWLLVGLDVAVAVGLVGYAWHLKIARPWVGRLLAQATCSSFLD